MNKATKEIYQNKILPVIIISLISFFFVKFNLKSITNTYTADTISFAFEEVIKIILLIGIIGRLFLFSKFKQALIILPAICVSLGVLGTFLGIYIGLKDFHFDAAINTEVVRTIPDTQNSSKSLDLKQNISSLLEGLKTAFSTSIIGMICSIILKLFYSIYPTLKKQKIEENENPLVLLQQNLSESKKSNQLNQEIILELKNGRIQFKKLMTDFASKIGESSTKAIVEGLQKVVENFNIMLNEMVGKSFEDLKQAMIKLTEWQENYKLQLETSIEQLEVSAESNKISSEAIEKMKDSISIIEKKMQFVSESYLDYQEIHENLSAYIKHIRTNTDSQIEMLTEIKKIGDSAKTVLPAIKTNINELTNGLTNAVTQNMQTLDTSFEMMQQSAKKHHTEIDKTIKQLEESLEKQLSESLRSLGGTLASLSEKFAQDYIPLTEKLQAILQLASNIEQLKNSKDRLN